MNTIAINLKSKEDKKIFTSLAKRLNLKTRLLNLDEKEDIALAEEIDKGRKSGYVDEETILKTLSKVKGK